MTHNAAYNHLQPKLKRLTFFKSTNDRYPKNTIVFGKGHLADYSIIGIAIKGYCAQLILDWRI